MSHTHPRQAVHDVDGRQITGEEGDQRALVVQGERRSHEWRDGCLRLVALVEHGIEDNSNGYAGVGGALRADECALNADHDTYFCVRQFETWTFCRVCVCGQFRGTEQQHKQTPRIEEAG